MIVGVMICPSKVVTKIQRIGATNAECDSRSGSVRRLRASRYARDARLKSGTETESLPESVLSSPQADVSSALAKEL